MIWNSPRDCTKRRFLPASSSTEGRLFLQIGAGAGNLDARNLDGFTEFVRRQQLTANDAVVLVEPNPANVDLLQEYWRSHANVLVVPVAVLPSGASESELILWYALEDGPNYQCASYSKEHVTAHFPQGTIQSIRVPTMTFDELMCSIGGDHSPHLIAIDVESLDADLIMSIDWHAYPFRAISFESLHLGEEESLIQEHLRQYGYQSAGVGLDLNGLDSLVIKSASALVRIRAHIWELERVANLRYVSGNPWKAFLHLVDHWRRRRLAKRG